VVDAPTAASAGEQAPPAAPRSPFMRSVRAGLPLLLPMAAIVVLILFFFWQRVFITIDAGTAGVLFRLFSGTETDRVYPPGLHIIAPWNRMHRYEVRKQTVLHSFDVLSVHGLTLHLELAIRYRPEYQQLGLLHQRIGPDYAQRVVVPQTESVLRRELGRRTAEDIYTNAGGLLSAAVALAREEVRRNFVEAEDIVIRSVGLPERVRQAIEDKLVQRELLESYVFRLQTAVEEAERKRDEARGIRDYQAAVDSTLSDRLLRHEGIRATEELAVSANTRVVLIGAREDGLPVIPGGGR